MWLCVGGGVERLWVCSSCCSLVAFIRRQAIPSVGECVRHSGWNARACHSLCRSDSLLARTPISCTCLRRRLELVLNLISQRTTNLER
ncbi:hypothetical protein BD310DRAFT_919885 [Dichomitus squalens]|uniref:Uncharacterized protein n=1 Tax=Dichomitus squalens TaxID=114155 RepID=A0A4Q9Q3G5_9APHY|nr:hypothetical protein BD310DRAFT_919885 [Dichomitus squalens]